MSATPPLIPVPYRDITLYLVEHRGCPHTPLRLLVEALGLDWRSHSRSLRADPGNRFGTRELLLSLPGAPPRRMCCVPLRRLHGWLLALDTEQSGPAVRRRLEDYRDCDEVLWEGWRRYSADGVADGDDLYDDYTLAAACFGELNALFSALHALTSNARCQTLARLGHERADGWQQWYAQRAEQVLPLRGSRA